MDAEEMLDMVEAIEAFAAKIQHLRNEFALHRNDHTQDALDRLLSAAAAMRRHMEVDISPSDEPPKKSKKSKKN